MVHVIGRLVEQQDRRIADQRARHSDGLTLAAGEALAALTHRHVVAHRVGRDEVFDPGHARRLEDPLIGRVRQAQRDVLSHRAAEQHHVLRCRADVGAQVHRIDLAYLGAVEQHRALVGRVEPEDDLGHRGLARAHAADDADILAGLNCEGHLSKRREALLGWPAPVEWSTA